MVTPLRSVAVLGLLLTMNACGTPSGGSTAGGDDEAAASGVALRYATALFNGRVDQARTLVERASQPTFGLVAAGLAQSAVRATGLSAGRTQVTGDRATTTLVGDLCRVSGTATPSPDDCVSNHDTSSNNPIFKVATARQSSGSWLVTLTTPAGTTPGGSGPTPPAANLPVPPS